MVLGTYKDIVTARATDKQIQKVSQDGGIVTALFAPFCVKIFSL